MEFRDLRQQYQLHKKELDAAIQSVLNNADFINGSKVKQLEEELSKYVGMRNCITCANGTDALQLALLAWNIRKGDVVFIPNLSLILISEPTRR